MVKINKLEIENVKRVKAVQIEPTANGLTVVGGRNGQGKTSVLDSIAWALGGNSYKPSNPLRDGSVVQPIIKIQLDNGLIVERKGEDGKLKVTDPSGKKAGQNLLNSFVEQFAINLPKFMEMNSKEKTKALLNTVDGLGEKLYQIEQEELEIYNKRRTVGQIRDQKKHFAEEQPFFKEVGNELVSASELIKEQQEILAKNGENQRKRDNLDNLKAKKLFAENKKAELEAQLKELNLNLEQLNSDIEIANRDVVDLIDESTEELERSIENIEEINRKVRANQDRERAEKDAEEYKNQYEDLTNSIEELRKQKLELLNGANLPLEELSVDNGVITYKGQPWDNMSGSEQLIVATAIVRKINPQCEFVLVDKLEQMDLETLVDFGNWLKDNNLQAIATRVSTGEECQIIIEDGYVKNKKTETPSWANNVGGSF
nr:MAG TPA: STRUCTURAL MAINTENANCE OF CHROMOSOMES PROTEIN [Caudoviricetes sp.]